MFKRINNTLYLVESMFLKYINLEPEFSLDSESDRDRLSLLVQENISIMNFRTSMNNYR